jgi:HNH endonuclease
MYKDRHIKVEVKCEQCGDLFMAQQSRVKLGQARFCSRKCFHAWQKENPTQLRGYENGKRYWGGEYWIIRWYDESGGQHTTPYPKWWWTMNRGEVPDGYYVSYKDENSENIDPSNFVCIPASDVRRRNVKRHIGMKRSEESKRRMSEVKIGKPLSVKHRENLSKSLKMRWAHERDNRKTI